MPPRKTPTQRPLPWKVGELARHTGVSVRTLHHYDETGVLRPSLRTASGHRLYDRADLARLQQVLSLRRLGFALEEVRTLLDGPDRLAPGRIVELHLARVRADIEARRRLAERLEAVAARLATAGEVPADTLLETIEAITMIETHFTPEQRNTLAARRDALGEARIREVESEWPRLMDAVQAEMDAGTDPADPRVQALAARWMALVAEFSGGDPALAAGARRVWEEADASVGGIDAERMRALMAYVGRARAAAA